jgi:hypothetical protein
MSFMSVTGFPEYKVCIRTAFNSAIVINLQNKKVDWVFTNYTSSIPHIGLNFPYFHNYHSNSFINFSIIFHEF